MIVRTEEKLKWTCDNIHSGKRSLGSLIEFPSIQFGVEIAFQSLVSETPFTFLRIYKWYKIHLDKRFDVVRRLMK
jgi:hypothetical protein